MRTTQLVLSAMLVCAGATPLLSQKDYVYASTGQQKLLINPAFSAGSRGLDIQTLASSQPGYNPSGTIYTGVSYGGKRLSLGLSNSYYKGILYSSDYYSNQTDLSLSYKARLGSKVSLVSSVQASLIEKKVDPANTFDYWYLCDPFIFSPSGSIIPLPYDNYAKKQAFSFSSGLLLDINKTLTFGAAIYDINRPDVGFLYPQKLLLTQHYHISLLLFKDKKINLQPYTIIKLQGGGLQKYAETGVFTRYKIFSLHAGLRNYFVYAHVQDHLDFVKLNEIHTLLGMSITYKSFKLGYTFRGINRLNNAHEVFLSACLFNKDNKAMNNLMLN